MIDRVLVNPPGLCNEAWNFDPSVDSQPSNYYKDDLILGKPNSHRIANGDDFFCDFYKHFAIDVVTETVFHYPYAFITEKTIRPIVHKRLFLIVGVAGTLRMLHEFGFRSFPDFINEDYDDIENSHQRLKFIINELDRIRQFSIDEMQQTVLQYKDTLQHNYDQYHWLCNNEIEKIVDKL